MQITKWVLANIIFPVLVGLIVVNWGSFQQKIIASLVAAIFTALIGDLVLMYPRISGYIKRRANITEPQKVSLVSIPKANNQVCLKLCTKAYILVRRIEIGTKDRWLIIYSNSLSLDAGKCKEIDFVRLYKPLEYFSLIETHQENENSFQRFRHGVHVFDVHIGFRFSKNGTDQDRYWHAKVDYSESGEISVEIKDIK
jgi:hypothetical protein